MSDNFFNLIPGYKNEITFTSEKEINLDMIKLKSLTDSF